MWTSFLSNRFAENYNMMRGSEIFSIAELAMSNNHEDEAPQLLQYVLK